MYLANYLIRIGFRMVQTASETTPNDAILASNTYETFLASNTPARLPRYLWRSSTDFVTMECSKIVSWEKAQVGNQRSLAAMVITTQATVLDLAPGLRTMCYFSFLSVRMENSLTNVLEA
jgi:hypothetical protein